VFPAAVVATAVVGVRVVGVAVYIIITEITTTITMRQWLQNTISLGQR
jgi:hypothetical protein